jgi:hypothetical protein
MTAKRYGTSSMECENGIYVLHAEYEKVVAERERLRAESDALMMALADCREAAFDEEVDNPYLGGAVGDPLEVPAFVAYAFEWVCGMRDQWKANHDSQVSRARFLIERGDIPVERVRAYQMFGALLALEEAVRAHRAMYEGTSDEDNMSALSIGDAIAELDAARKEKA